MITRPPSSGPSPSEPDTSAYFPSAVTARPTGPKLPVGMIASTAFSVMLFAGSSAFATLTTVTVPAWPCWKSAAAFVVTEPEWLTTYAKRRSGDSTTLTGWPLAGVLGARSGVTRTRLTIAFCVPSLAGSIALARSITRIVLSQRPLTSR